MNQIFGVVRLGDIAEINYGYTAKASFDCAGPKFLRITDIQNGAVDWQTVPVCPINQVDLSKHRLQEDDIVFARTGATTGKSYKLLSPPEAVAASYLIRLRIHDEEILPDFVSLFFQTKAYWDSIAIGTSGSAQGGFNASKLAELHIPKPPLPKQKRIVAILDEAFAGIDAAVANTEKNLANGRELFESYLNAVFTRKGEGWVEKKLGDVCQKIQDGAHHSPKKLYTEKDTGRFLYITSKNIRNNYMDLTKIQYVDSDFHETIYPRCKPELGDVLLTKDGANTGNVTLNTIDEPFSLLSSVCLIKPDRSSLNPSFLKYYIQSRPGFEQIMGKMTGAAIKRIVLKTIKAATVPMPGVIKQASLVESFDALLEETQHLDTIYQKKLAALAELKQAILQKAFAGELTAQPDQTLAEAVA